MIRRGNGNVMNVSSTSRRTHQSLFPVYAATKHGFGAFTEVLRKEVHPNRIRVTRFEPGPTGSELGSHADSKVMRSMADDFSGVEFLKAEDVAQGILWTSPSPTG